ncbi:MAG: pyruvate formate lyase family protein, partial [Pseudomonadota bacterium]
SVNNENKAVPGTTAADERGIYFAGFVKSAAILENIMNNQVGSVPGYMNDRLFNNVKSNLGGLFYIPSVPDLGLEREPGYANDFSKLERGDWTRFPGVDWSRLDRHFDKASDNGLMFYNHKNYLYRMATLPQAEKEKCHAPTTRILSLLENAFSLWQDNWYIDRKQEEIAGDIRDYLSAYAGTDKPDNIMAESVMVRKGWATRLSLHLFASDEYGFRGRRVRQTDGTLVPYAGHDLEQELDIVNGANTFHIQPNEIIVGGMPNLSLGEGCYVMRYLTDDEHQAGFIAGLSEASGVGHIIPDFDKLLQHGLGDLIADATVRHDAAIDPAKRDFYQATILSLQGVSEYLLRFADLAAATAKTLSDGEAWEKTNL